MNNHYYGHVPLVISQIAWPEDMINGYWHLPLFKMRRHGRFLAMNTDPVDPPYRPGYTMGYLASHPDEPLRFHWTELRDKHKRRLYRIQMYRDHSDLE